MGILIGTQGWNYDAWVGPLYPPGTRPAEFLSTRACFRTTSALGSPQQARRAIRARLQFVEQTDELAAACRRSTQTIFPVAHKRHPPAPILDREKEEPITIRFAATRKQSRGFPHRSSTQNKLERVTFNEREGFLGGRGIPTIAA